MEENQNHVYSAKAILWYPIFDFFFETARRIKFIYFYWNDFPNFGV